MSLNEFLIVLIQKINLLVLFLRLLKKTGFIAGADISNFRNLEDPKDARIFIERGQFYSNE